MCVGGLGFIGYLGMISQDLRRWGATNANIAIGLISAVDNIPVMFAVLTMMPVVDRPVVAGDADRRRRRLLLSIGSAAGVALMGQARGVYTFFGHLKWTPRSRLLCGQHCGAYAAQP